MNAIYSQSELLFMGAHTSPSTLRIFSCFLMISSDQAVKNCSACERIHTAPLGRYCKSAKLEFNDLFGLEHNPLLGADCEWQRPTGPTTLEQQTLTVPTMVEAKPSSDDFMDRSDHEYIAFLEKQVLASRESKQAQLDLSYVLRRLSVLEISQSRQHVAAAGGLPASCTTSGVSYWVARRRCSIS